MNRSALLHRWAELERDPAIVELPYKIELNAWGKVEMSPASVRHGQQQAALAEAFRQQLAAGTTITECPIVTDIGIRVSDLAWASAQFMQQHAGLSPLPRAPEICVEVISPSNLVAEITEKTRAYLAAGAHEVWLATRTEPSASSARAARRPPAPFRTAFPCPT